MRIHQLLAGAAAGDAITRIARNTQPVLSRYGSSDIYAHHIDPSAASMVHPLAHLPEDATGDDVIVLRASIGDHEIASALEDRPERLIVAYHNITPSEFFGELDPAFGELLQLGRDQLRALRPRCVAAFADSTFNADDLASLGYEGVEVVAPLIDPRHLLDLPPDPGYAIEIERRAPAEVILFVGQLLPHKRPDLLIAAHHLLISHHRPDATLVLAGAHRFPEYVASLAQFAATLNLPRVWFTGAVSDSELAELYRRADVFVTASSHEGFCVPVVEAMAASVPVITSTAGALPETVGRGGMVMPDIDPPLLAETIDLLLESEERAEWVLRGRRRAAELSFQSANAQLVSFLESRL